MGYTTFVISIMHEGHADYTSMPILVTVNEEEHCDEIADQAECDSSEHCVWDTEDSLCEDEHDHDDDHDHDHGECDEDDHVDVDGLVLEYNGTEIYSQFQGLIEGSLELHVNDTKDISIHFLDSDGNELISAGISSSFSLTSNSRSNELISGIKSES